jgi:hypothetical protein
MPYDFTVTTCTTKMDDGSEVYDIALSDEDGNMVSFPCIDLNAALHLAQMLKTSIENTTNALVSIA